MTVDLTGESAKIWEEIKHVELDLFGLPDQTIEKNCTPLNITPDKLYVTVPASAIFAALDVALAKNFDVEQVGKWYTISRKLK